MRRWKKLLLAVLAAVPLLLSGCMLSASAEDLYALPQLPREYESLSAQLSEVLSAGAEYAAPQAGGNLPPVQMKDLDGDGVDEVLAFFRINSEDRPLKIYIFRAVEEGYEQAALIEGSGTSFHSVRYVDMDGDGEDELVELRAEKAYFGNESEPEKLFEGDGVMHPYTLVVTQGETVWELPLGWEDNGFPPLNPIYWDEERTGRGWTRDRAGRPVLVLWFDSFSRVLDVYALGVQGGEPVLLPVPEGEFQAEPDHWPEWYY